MKKGTACLWFIEVPLMGAILASTVTSLAYLAELPWWREVWIPEFVHGYLYFGVCGYQMKKDAER